jgi:riboflavin synthase
VSVFFAFLLVQKSLKLNREYSDFLELIGVEFMFTGIVEEVGSVISVDNTDVCRLEINSKLDHSATRVGDSIAINGVCLTVVSVLHDRIFFDVSNETLRKTNLAALKIGDKVNIEMALRVGDKISGHFVFGHVDCVLELSAIEKDGLNDKFIFIGIGPLRHLFAPKGSVTINGVSLTIGEVDSNSFSVYLIPHTLDATTFATLSVGSKVNVEIDMLARYVANILAYQNES